MTKVTKKFHNTQFSVEELEAVKKDADTTGIAVGEWIRRACKQTLKYGLEDKTVNEQQAQAFRMAKRLVFTDYYGENNIQAG